MVLGPLALLACVMRASSFTDDQGLEGGYRMIVPEGADGALLFFTWDGGGADLQRQARLREEIATRHGLIVVAMRAPEGDCWWTPRVQAYARYVEAFVQRRLVEEQGVDPTRIFTTGLSGGSDFAAAFPYHTGFRYGGGVVALCGGDVPRLDGGDCAVEADPPPAPALGLLDPAVYAGVRYDFAIAANDELLDASRRAAAYYEAAGFTHVRHRVVPGDGHCGFDEGFEGLEALAAGLAYVDPRTSP